MDKILTKLENFFAEKLAIPHPRKNTVSEPCAGRTAVHVSIGENSFGGFSIYIKNNIRIGNYPTEADARRMAENWNFFVVEN